jgi:hypothetical protein
MIRYLLILFLTGLWISGAGAADRLDASFDWALFAARADTLPPVRLEVYYLLDRNSLAHPESAEGRVGVYTAYLQVFAGDSTVFSTAWERRDVLSGAAPESGQKIPDMLPVHLHPGRYRVEAALRDEQSGAVAADRWEVEINAPLPWKRGCSGMMFTSQAPQQTDTGGMFVRDGYLVVPYAAAIYGAELPHLYYFLEVYSHREDAPGKLRFSSRILDNRETLLVSGARDSVALSPGENRLLFGAMDVGGLPSGSYYLDLTLDFPDDREEGLRKKFFPLIHYRN